MADESHWNKLKRKRQMEQHADGMLVFLTMGMRTKKVTLEVPTTLDGIRRTFLKAFYVDEGEVPPPADEYPRECFLLRHREYGVEYEGFNPLDVFVGAIIRVRDLHTVNSTRSSEREVEPSVIVPTKVLELVRIDSSRTAKTSPSSPSGSSGADIGNRGRGGPSSTSSDHRCDEHRVPYQERTAPSQLRSAVSNIKSAIWITLEDPSSSNIAFCICIFILLLILFSTVTFCLETMPIFYEHEKKKTSIWYIMEASSIACFTTEFALRAFTCPNFVEFTKNILNYIDFLAIAPFYIELALESVEVPGLSVLRVVRLVRVFRLFKVSRGSITIFAHTMIRSAKPLYMLIFFTSLATILFSSLMYFAERGVYDSDLHAWMRVKYYECDTYVTTFPAADMNSEYLVPSGVPDYNGGYCRYLEPQPAGLMPGVGVFLCPYTFKDTSRQCWKVWEQSPFSSIPRTCWWCLTTMTTVGYGDMYPTNWYGKLLGVIVMMFGIIVIALPITVIGSNFTKEYRMSLEDEAIQEIGEDAQTGGDAKSPGPASS